MDIYVGNLPYEVSDEELEAVFAEYGQVASARVITDRFSGRPAGLALLRWATSPRRRRPSTR